LNKAVSVVNCCSVSSRYNRRRRRIWFNDTLLTSNMGVV